METECAGIFDSHCGYMSSYLQLWKSWDAKNTVAVGASRVTSVGDSEHLQSVFLPVEIEAFDTPEHLILVSRCRENDIWNGNSIQMVCKRSYSPCCHPRRYPDVKMTNFCDALLGPLFRDCQGGAGFRLRRRRSLPAWFYITKPREMPRTQTHLLQPDDALRRC